MCIKYVLKKERLESNMKKYIKAKALLESKANRKEKKPIYATRKLSIGLVSCMLGLVMATPVVNAEEANLNQPQQVQEENQPADNGVEDPDTNHAPVPLEKDETPQEGLNGLETQDADKLQLGPELVGQPVTAAVKKPTVNPLLYDDTTISGGNLAKARVNKKLVIATVHVTLKGEDGTVKATLEDTPTSGTTWKVKLPKGVKVAKGDTVTVYQQIGEDKSEEVSANAQPSKASSVTLTMPSGEIWIEQYVANIVNKDEKAEAIDLLKKANPDIANDIKSVEFNITGTTTKTASYIVTYKDNSKTEEIQAPDLKINQVTETSRSPEIYSITIVDNVIKGKLAGQGPFNGIKVQLVIRVNKDKADKYCNENKCTVDKDSSDPIEVSVNDDGTFSYTLQEGESLNLDQIVGVSVKEPHKFVSCSTTTVKPVTVEKTEVKDPKRLTEDNKTAIINAIKEAYKAADGTSKLPNGTGDWDGLPAIIQIDDNGDAKIYSGNDTAGDFDKNNGYKFVPEKNKDGSNKVKEGAQPKTTIPAKDLVKNLKPEKPALKAEDGNVIITPDKVDTDAKTIAVSFKDKNDKDQKIVATKADNGTWSITEGNDLGATVENGIVTLPKDKVKGGTDVTATVTDKGGVADDDKTPLTSDPGTLTIGETIADKVNELGGLDPVVMKKWVGDTLDWKDGVKAKDSTKESEVNKLLAGATFTDATEEKRSTTKEGDFTGKVKVKFSDDSEIIVEKQMLYVNNNVTSMDREDKVPKDALDVEFKLGEGVKVDDKDPNTGSVTKTTEGNKDTPVLYKKYKVKPNTNLSNYKNPTLGKTIFELIDETAKNGYTEPVWNDSKKGTNFVVSSDNKEFTATATEVYKVTAKANGGTGDDKVAEVKKGEKYKLPKADTFKAPENQVFQGWQVGDDKELKQPGIEIDITKDTEVKAIWKKIEAKVSFNPGDGATGTMEEKTVNKGDTYTLPDHRFTVKPGKVFLGWRVPGESEVKKPGDSITVNGNTEVTAIWTDKADPGTEPGTNPGNKPGTTPGEKAPDKEKPTDPTKPAEPGKDNPTDPSKPGEEKPKTPSEKDPNKPGVKVPSRDDKKTPGKVEKGDKVIKKGDTEIVVPKEALTEENGKIKTEDRPKIVDKFKEKNPDLVDVKIHDNGNVSLSFKDGTRAELSAKDLRRDQGIKIPRKQSDVSPMKRAGKNAKTGIESVAGLVCTLVASTGALYIGRKKED